MEELTIAQLQARLVELGVPESEAKAIRVKAPLITFVNTLLAKDAVKEVEKVDSIEERPNPSEDRQVNKNWKSKAEKMQDHLESQERVSILIPLEPGEKRGTVEERVGKNGRKYQVAVSGAVDSVQLNGFKYFIPKGVYTSVPRQIAEVISNSQQQTLEAGKDFLLDRQDPTLGGSVRDRL